MEQRGYSFVVGLMAGWRLNEFRPGGSGWSQALKDLKILRHWECFDGESMGVLEEQLLHQLAW